MGLGLLAFFLFGLGDWNDWKWEQPLLRLCFPAGLLLLGGATAGMAAGGTGAAPAAFRTACMVLGAAFLALLVYTLFFALRADEAYVSQKRERPVCSSGVYALCRHPGVWWFFFLYLCLWGAFGVPLTAVFAFSALNVLLVVFEDALVFPARLSGYGEYKRSTPFLLPTAASLRACFGAARGGSR